MCRKPGTGPGRTRVRRTSPVTRVPLPSGVAWSQSTSIGGAAVPAGDAAAAGAVALAALVSSRLA